MQWHKNKLLVSSAVYAASLAVIAIMFGLWHNSFINGEKVNNLLFISLLFLTLAFFSWFYFTIFKTGREEKENTEERTKVVDFDLLDKTIENVAEEKPTESFDKDIFIKEILADNKKGLEEYCETLLKNLANKLNIVIGLFYVKSKTDELYESIARYAYYSEKTPPDFVPGESLPGQAVKDKRVLIITNVPESYLPVVSGLGNSKPRNIVMIPIIANNEPVGLIEIAMFKPMEPTMEPVLKDLGLSIGKDLIKLLK